MQKLSFDWSLGFDVTLRDPGKAVAEAFIIEDGPYRDRAAWIPFSDFASGKETLLPDGLLDLLA